MPRKSHPRSGSLQYRPWSRAKKETPSFSSFEGLRDKKKPLNFFGYKAGMIHVFAKNERPKSTSVGQQVRLPATIIECPPVKVFAVRVYARDENGRNLVSLGEVNAEKVDSVLLKKIHSFHKSHRKKEEKKKDGKKPFDWDAIEKNKSRIVAVRLLVHTQPELTNFGKKRPDVSEIALGGSVEDQLRFAKEKLGQAISVRDVFDAKQLIDVKAVSRGKGMQGVVRRHNIKTQRHKAKKPRTVGSISPWHPPTVMWTVARPGQMGYNNRTEFNKLILELGSSGKTISPLNGFEHYGPIQSDFVVIAGSIPGPAKRCIALRHAIRAVRPNRFKFGDVSFYSSVREKIMETDETPHLGKVRLAAEKKQETKSVEEELKEAAKKA